MGEHRPPEYVLASRLGLRQLQIVAVRKTLQQGIHWQRHGNRIEWTDEGLKALYEKLGLTPHAEALQKTLPVDEIKQLEAVQTKFFNRHVITAKNGSGEVVRVWVKDSAAFKPRMKIWARPGPGPVWRCVGKVKKTQYGV